MSPSDSVCILPKLEGVGGPASFRARITAGLAARGVQVCLNPDDPTCRAVLVIGGTRRIADLLVARRRGLPIVQRLNGMNWIHRRRWTGLRHYLRSEVNNALLSSIRRFLAVRIVYQSNFTQAWWQRVYGTLRAPGSVVYNGVDLTQYTPGSPVDLPDDRFRLLVVEGHLGGGHEIELESAAKLVQLLSERLPKPVEMIIAGDAPAPVRAEFETRLPGQMFFKGIIPRGEVRNLYHGAHLIFSTEINAACPNTVIEALASGLPVLAFNTGALAELLGDSGCGRVVSWGGDPWKLDAPDVSALADAAYDILSAPESYRLAARARAEAVFGLDAMVDGYLKALFPAA